MDYKLCKTNKQKHLTAPSLWEKSEKNKLQLPKVFEVLLGIIMWYVTLHRTIL